jgi:hypothetical protein
MWFFAAPHWIVNAGNEESDNAWTTMGLLDTI